MADLLLSAFPRVAMHPDGLPSRATSLLICNSRGTVREILLKNQSMILHFRMSLPYFSVKQNKQWVNSTWKSSKDIQAAPEEAVPDWAMAIVVDSDELPRNLKEITRPIAKKCNFNYLPPLTLFKEARALFFCKNMADSLMASLVAYLRMGTWTNFLNKYSRDG